MMLLAFLIGAVVGLSELLSRYSWSVRSILLNMSGWMYLVLNGCAAIVAYQLAIDFNIAFGLDGKPEWWRASIVALLSMAFLRSAFANIKIGERSVGVGLVSFIEIFKKRAERDLDQELTKWRLRKVGALVAELPYESAGNYLIHLTITTLPSLSDQDREDILRETTKIASMEVNNEKKMLLLAMRLEHWLGQNLLVEMVAEAARKYQAEATQSAVASQGLHERLAILKASLEQ
jgi:hypothetical protein